MRLSQILLLLMLTLSNFSCVQNGARRFPGSSALDGGNINNAPTATPTNCPLFPPDPNCGGSNASAPFISYQSPQTYNINTPFNITPTLSGTQPITCAVIGQLPIGVAINSNTCSIFGLLTNTGTHTINVAASNSAGSTTGTFVLNINSGQNQAPIISYQTPQTININTSFTITATLSGTQPITCSATGLPSGATINSNSCSIVGLVAIAGTYTINVTATNSGGSTAKTIVVNFINPNNITGCMDINAFNYNELAVTKGRCEYRWCPTATLPKATNGWISETNPNGGWATTTITTDNETGKFYKTQVAAENLANSYLLSGGTALVVKTCYICKDPTSLNYTASFTSDNYLSGRCEFPFCADTKADNYPTSNTESAANTKADTYKNSQTILAANEQTAAVLQLSPSYISTELDKNRALSKSKKFCKGCSLIANSTDLAFNAISSPDETTICKWGKDGNNTKILFWRCYYPNGNIQTEYSACPPQNYFAPNSGLYSQNCSALVTQMNNYIISNSSLFPGGFGSPLSSASGCQNGQDVPNIYESEAVCRIMKARSTTNVSVFEGQSIHTWDPYGNSTACP
jgi:hypothetical protein